MTELHCYPGPTHTFKQIDDALHSLNFKWELKLFDHALQYYPENKFLISKAVFGYLFLGMGERSLPYLDRHLKYSENDFNELILLATLLFDKGYKSQGMVYFNQAKKIKPEEPKLVAWFSDRGMMNEAVNLLNEQLKKQPENKEILGNAVHLFLKMGVIEKALVYFNHLRQLSPSGAEMYKSAGLIAESERKMQEALSCYGHAIKKDPNDLSTIIHLVALYSQEKMWDEAIGHFRLALKKNPNEPILLEGLGRLLISCPDQKFTDAKEGIEYSERAFINYRSFVVTKISAGKNLVRGYAMLGNKKKQMSIYRNQLTW